MRLREINPLVVIIFYTQNACRSKHTCSSFFSWKQNKHQTNQWAIKQLFHGLTHNEDHMFIYLLRHSLVKNIHFLFERWQSRDDEHDSRKCYLYFFFPFFFTKKKIDGRASSYSASNRFRFSFSPVCVIDKKQTLRDSLMKPRFWNRWTIFISIKLLRTMEGRIVSLFITGEGVRFTIYRDDFERRNAADQIANGKLRKIPVR